MTIKYMSPEEWRKEVYVLIHKPSKSFKIEFVTPVEFHSGKVTRLMIGYWFIER